MVLASGVAQAVMLAAVGVAVLWFRHAGDGGRLTPSRAWDVLLWISAGGLMFVGGWTVWRKLADVAAALGSP